MMNNPQVIVALNNISKIPDGKRILTKLDFETYDGEFLTLQHTSSGGTSPLLREIKRLMGLTSARLGIKPPARVGSRTCRPP